MAWRPCVSLSAGVLGQRAAVAADPRTGSAIDEQRAGTVHGTRDEDISTRAAGGRPILRARFLMRWSIPPIFLKKAEAGAASATQTAIRSIFIIV
jgi:hypothetical protein